MTARFAARDTKLSPNLRSTFTEPSYQALCAVRSGRAREGNEMKTKVSLLAGAALGLALATGAVAPAQAQAAKRQPPASAAEVEALKDQVRALTERLNAQEARQRELEEQARQAQAAAEAVRVQAADEIKTIPQQVTTAVAAAQPKPGWEASTSVNGRMYFNLGNVDIKRDGAKVASSGTGFDIKRFYIGVDHRFDSTYSGNITTDVQYNAAEGLTQIYIKKAYLQAKVSDALTVRLGSADLPWVPFAEGAYGYRFLENTVADRTKFGTSADWGVHASGKLPVADLSYAVSVINGAGYKNPVRSKSVDVEGRLSTTFGPIVVGVGGYRGKLGKDVQGAVTRHTASRVDALAAYRDDRLRLGVEYFATKNWNNVTSVAEDKSDGYSVFGSYDLTPKVSVFGRYDWVNPSKSLNPDFEDNYFNLGINYEPAKTVDLAIVYKRDQVDNGLLGTSNGTIGGVNKGVYDEIGLFGQFRW